MPQWTVLHTSPLLLHLLAANWELPHSHSPADFLESTQSSCYAVAWNVMGERKGQDDMEIKSEKSVVLSNEKKTTVFSWLGGARLVLLGSGCRPLTDWNSELVPRIANASVNDNHWSESKCRSLVLPVDGSIQIGAQNLFPEWQMPLQIGSTGAKVNAGIGFCQHSHHACCASP